MEALVNVKVSAQIHMYHILQKQDITKSLHVLYSLSCNGHMPNVLHRLM